MPKTVLARVLMVIVDLPLYCSVLLFKITIKIIAIILMGINGIVPKMERGTHEKKREIPICHCAASMKRKRNEKPMHSDAAIRSSPRIFVKCIGFCILCNAK